MHPVLLRRVSLTSAMIVDLMNARSELGQGVASVLWRLERCLTIAATLPMGRNASVSLHRVLRHDTKGTDATLVDAVMLEPGDPARASRALVRAAVSELVGRAMDLPPEVLGTVVRARGHYHVRPSVRNTILYSFVLQTTKRGLVLFREEARADLDRCRPQKTSA